MWIFLYTRMKHFTYLPVEELLDAPFTQEYIVNHFIQMIFRDVSKCQFGNIGVDVWTLVETVYGITMRYVI